MNKPNNKKRKQSQEKIEKVFIELLQTKELNQISVTDICKTAHLNRSTFYANYIDIYDLADKVKEKLELEVKTLYNDETTKKYNSNDYLKLFYHIKENQLFYKTYFKLGFDNKHTIFRYDTNLSKEFFDDKFIDNPYIIFAPKGAKDYLIKISHLISELTNLEKLAPSSFSPTMLP